MSATVPRGFRFEQTIPYDTPESLDELQGPTSGTVRLLIHGSVGSPKDSNVNVVDTPFGLVIVICRCESS